MDEERLFDSKANSKEAAVTNFRMSLCLCVYVCV